MPAPIKEPRDDPRHGSLTWASGRNRCGCDSCKGAWRRYMAAYNAEVRKRRREAGLTARGTLPVRKVS